MVHIPVLELYENKNFKLGDIDQKICVRKLCTLDKT